MASTSTNKQPLLIDRVFHSAVDTQSLSSGSGSSLKVQGANSSTILVDCTQNDGAVVESIYTIAQVTIGSDAKAPKLSFHLSSSFDYLRPAEAELVGVHECAKTQGEYKYHTTMPRVLAPVAHTTASGEERQLTAIYVPGGRALWVTVVRSETTSDDKLPVVGAQGGFY